MMMMMMTMMMMMMMMMMMNLLNHFVNTTSEFDIYLGHVVSLSKTI